MPGITIPIDPCVHRVFELTVSRMSQVSPTLALQIAIADAPPTHSIPVARSTFAPTPFTARKLLTLVAIERTRRQRRREKQYDHCSNEFHIFSDTTSQYARESSTFSLTIL
jgi:hypothetical protein